MPRRRSEPKAMNSPGSPVSPLTGAPPVMRKTTPRTSTIVPSVVMKGLTLRKAMTRPLASPTAAPAMTPATTPAAMPASSMTMLATQPESAAIERDRDASLPHSENAVAQPRKLGEIAGIDHCAGAAGDEIGEERVDLRLGRNVDALGRIVEQQHCNAPRQPFRQDHFLLIAAGQRACF